MARLAKPFLVQSDHEGGNIFRVTDLDDFIPRSAVERLLERLPIYFRLQKRGPKSYETLNEPLEVNVSGVIVFIYPPRDRIIACTTLMNSDTARRLGVDNIMDMDSHGPTQIRSCIHFAPELLGVEDFPHPHHPGIEVDIFVYPSGVSREPIINPPPIDVEDLLKLIAGGDEKLTSEQVSKWRALIMYAVDKMRVAYENEHTAPDDPMRMYYQPCWKMIQDAGANITKFIEALEFLRTSIKER